MSFCGGREPQYTIPLPAGLTSLLEGKEVSRILDLGCGNGRTCFFLQKSGFEVVGVDIDNALVRLAFAEMNSRRIPAGIDLFVNDARHLCFQDCSFEAVTMLGVLTLVPREERSKIMMEVEKVLESSGYVFIEEFLSSMAEPSL
jgi:ubiquinone/menaquinone biosynthesis C-methylase UbiE